MTQATQPAPAISMPHSAAVAGARSPLLLFWQVLGHSLWLDLLLLITAAAFAAHVLLPQLPTALAADPIARSAWLTDAATRLSGGQALNALGLLDLAHSNALRLLLPLLAATLLLRLLNRLQLARNSRRLAPPDHVLPSTRAFDLQLDAAAKPEQWQSELNARFQRAKVEPEAEGAGELWYADRNQRFTWFPALIEIGLLLLLLAFVLNLRNGWQIDDIRLDPGASIALTPYSAQTISLDPAAAELTLCCSPRRTLALSSADSPLVATRIRSAQRSPALAITATAAGEPLLLQGIEQGGSPTPDLLVHFPQARSERTVALPERNLFLRVAGAGPRQFRIQVLNPANDVLLSADLSDEQTFTLDDIALTLRPSHFVTLGVVSRPWLWLLLPALLLLGIGLALRQRYPYSRTGIRHNEAGVAVRWQGQSGGRPSPAELVAILSVPHPSA